MQKNFRNLASMTTGHKLQQELSSDSTACLDDSLFKSWNGGGGGGEAMQSQ